MKIKIIVPIILIVIIGLIYYLNYKEDTKNNVESANRTYDIELDFLYEIQHEYSFTDELIINDKIYLKDYHNQQIIETDLKGNFENIYGNQGGGPKENLMIRGFFIDELGYYTSDSQKNVISNVTFNNELIYHYKPSFHLSISGFLKSGKAIAKGNTVTEDKNTVLNFLLIDPKNESETRIDVSNIYDLNEPYSDWVYDGAFTPAADGGLFYIPHYSNTIIKFDNNGEIDYRSKLIYDVPKIVLTKAGTSVFPAENDAPHYYSSSNDGDFLYVQSSIGDSKHGLNTLIIDIYKSSNGTYFSSIPIKKSTDDTFPNSIKVYNNKLYLFYEQSIKVFQLTF